MCNKEKKEGKKSSTVEWMGREKKRGGELRGERKERETCEIDKSEGYRKE